MKNQKTLLLAIVCLIGFCAAAVIFNVFPLGELPASFVGAALGAVITGVVTVILLEGQSKAEEVKERNVKVFEKKSELFLAYIDMLWKAAEDQRLTAAEYEELRKNYSVRLMIYLQENASQEIAKHLKNLGTCVDSSENKYDDIKKDVFGIINVLSAELDLGGKIDLNLDKELEEPIFPLLFKQAVLNELNRSLKSQELNEGSYCKAEALIEDGEWVGEYICFDFRRFKGVKLVVGPFSKSSSESDQQESDQHGVRMMLFVEPAIRAIDRLRYTENKALIEIKDENEKQIELTGLSKGLFFDNPESIEGYRNTYKTLAETIGNSASHWFKNGVIAGLSIKGFLETYLGKESLLVKERLIKELNWGEHYGNKALIGEALNDTIFVGYELGSNWLGFVFEKKKMMKRVRDVLTDIINQPEFQENFGETGFDDYYFGKNLLTKNFKGDTEGMVKFVTEQCQLLQEKIQESKPLQEYLMGVHWWHPIRKKFNTEFGYSAAKNIIDMYYPNTDTSDIDIHFGANADEYRYWMGFYSGGGAITDDVLKRLQKILNTIMPKTYFDPAIDWGEPGRWLVKQFRITEYREESPDVAEYLAERYRLLQEKVEEVLEA